ncbi:MAG: hypothetical protein PHQ96_06365 [Candidatus Omnitrophica bacterium]|nr:hypothetical protein [Candidatus Omnitrophota bacterium]
MHSKRLKIILYIILLFLSIFAYKNRYDFLTRKIYTNILWSSKQYPRHSILNRQELLMLGWASRHNKWRHRTFYENYPIAKKTNVIRIGIFGGSETGSGGKGKFRTYDYPSLLQDRFDAAGMNNVEVISFGSNSYGLAQEFMLWQFVGRLYQLDYVILTIHDINRFRDASFSSGNMILPHIHARYILKDGNLKIIPLIGDNYTQTRKIYYGITPRLRYILYDRSMPMFLRVFLPYSLHKKTNPFYYKRTQSLNKELHPIYAAIFNQVAKQAKYVIAVVKKEDIPALSSYEMAPNVYLFNPQATKYLHKFLFFEPENTSYPNHHNALANSFIADEFFSLLTKAEKPEFNELKLIPCIESGSGKPATQQATVSEYGDITVKVGQLPVAYFATYVGLPFFAPVNGKSKHHGFNIASLLLLSERNMKYIAFAPLEFPLSDNQKVFLCFRKNNKWIKIPIGTIVTADGVLGKINIKKTDCEIVCSKDSDLKLVIKNRRIFTNLPVNPNDLCIMVGNNRIFTAKLSFWEIVANLIRRFSFKDAKGMKIKFKLDKFEYAYLKAQPEFNVDVEPFAEKEGTLDVVFVKGQGEEQRKPIFKYQLIPAQTAPFADGFKKYIIPRDLN